MNTQNVENKIVQQLREKVQTLWIAIQNAGSFQEQEALRRQYRETMSRFQLQRMLSAE